MEISPIDLRQIDLKAENVYEGIIVASKRAKQINDENKIEFNALISTIPENTTEDDNEDIDNPAQLKIALELEKKPKPHVQALNDLLDGDINFQYKE
ncbi:MAG TPA: DNA-directed RNA polymerase subunit omega [Ignavibacteriaceae bacterium]|nr:DNA-directed RNA polymerase subunit omega [Ignavibacteriaceae bacterium]